MRASGLESAVEFMARRCRLRDARWLSRFRGGLLPLGCMSSGTGSLTVAALKLAALQSLRRCARKRAVSYANFCSLVLAQSRIDNAGRESTRVSTRQARVPAPRGMAG